MKGAIWKDYGTKIAETTIKPSFLLQHKLGHPENRVSRSSRFRNTIFSVKAYIHAELF